MTRRYLFPGGILVVGESPFMVVFDRAQQMQAPVRVSRAMTRLVIRRARQARVPFMRLD